MVQAPAGPPFQIRSVADYTRWLKFFVYGEYGVGKTRLLGSAVELPQMQDVLFIDAEAGELTIATVLDKAYADAREKHFDVIRITKFSELARVQEFLKVHCKFRDEGNDAKLKELEQKLRPDDYDPNTPPKKYRTVIIDSLSEVETYSLYQLLGISDKTRIDEEAASPEWAEYKKNHSQILRMIRAFRDLPMHVMMTSATQYTQDEQKRFKYQPTLTGKLSKQCQGFMDIVGFLAIVQGEQGTNIRRLFCKPSARFDAKCRFSSFPGDYWDEPTMNRILKSVGLLEAAPAAKA
jgi:hypothetical protein